MADRLNEVLFNPPTWTDLYYQRERKQDSLDQIVDSAFFTKSHHAGMVQVADLFAFVFRRYAELTDYRAEPVCEGELENIEDLIHRLAPSLLPKSQCWIARARSVCGATFADLSPPVCAFCRRAATSARYVPQGTV